MGKDFTTILRESFTASARRAYKDIKKPYSNPYTAEEFRDDMRHDAFEHHLYEAQEESNYEE